ncbi:hypothetical protein Lalb_Chr13g0302081 [Lupinus albus]|uniref:Uncharacterized protein n=1 Tax=Lupinus albus TaxID=3870 RepID=A0A6A4PJZ3_LUPAL|nr:hypothetical protein Lalb_Chr13g0302081 [Lupinus albus]
MLHSTLFDPLTYFNPFSSFSLVWEFIFFGVHLFLKGSHFAMWSMLSRILLVKWLFFLFSFFFSSFLSC